MSAPRIARLTLFSGPQCSLCEIAKVELAKVKKQREFNLEVINIHEKGQEKWKKRYVYWIPALHLDGKEIAKVADPDDCFIFDTTPSISPSTPLPLLPQSRPCLYDRISGIALGEEEEEEEEDELLPSTRQDRLCFNCGSPDHAVASCPEPFDRQVVSLSRQLFHFLHPDLPAQQITRFYVAEGWKQQRLEWLRSFQPGVIRGPLLRDALGLEEGDPGDAVEWLRNMACWGYPPGWFGCRDPNQLVYSRILEGEEEVASEWEPFTIFEDDEVVELKLFSLRGSPSPSSSSSTSIDAEPVRWATYPNTYFSSTALSIYRATPLDKLVPSPSRVSATFTPDRRTLWECILSGGAYTSNPQPSPPWRLPGAFGASNCSGVDDVVENFVPPPPRTTPPPLPAAPLPSLHTSKFEGTVDSIEDTAVVDMEVSDSEE